MIFFVTQDRSQSFGCIFQIACLRWRSERRSDSLHPSEKGGRSRFIDIAKVRVCNSLDTSTTFSMSMFMSRHSRPGTFSLSVLRKEVFEFVVPTGNLPMDVRMDVFQVVPSDL